MSTNELKEVRILLLGESGVGKSSLILSLVSEQFIDQLDNSFDVPAKLEPIVIPAEVTLENVPGVIIDYSKREHNDRNLAAEIQRADVICLVYAMNDEETKLCISTYWLPKIHEINEEVRKPILIIGNKCDVCEKNIVHDRFISDLVARHPEIETCIECSAKSFKNVPEVFYYAQKSVLYPTTPLYHIETKELTVKCREALIRIFKLINHTNDGVLKDTELNQFQVKCFGINLQPFALNEVKTVIRKKSFDGLFNNSLTLKGFLILNTLFVEKGRHETIWRILKHFGYDRYLSLSKDYLPKVQRLDTSCSIELTQKAFDYLKYLFYKYDKDIDFCLNESELNDLFSVCPEYLVPKNAALSVKTSNNQFITYDGFLAYWVLTTYTDINKSLESLAYLGFSNYQDSLKNAYIVNRSKSVDNEEKKTYRNCFLCYVYGTRKCGKTSFLQGFLGRDLQFQATLPSNEQSNWSCNLIQVQNSDKFLILKEINSTEDITIHDEYPPDVICLLYDSTDPNSFKLIADIFLSIYNQKFTPTFIIATKCDQKGTQQNYPISTEKFAEMYNLPPVQYFSASSSFLKQTDIYTKLVTVASIPKLYPMRKTHWRFFQNFVNSIKSQNVNQNQSVFEFISTNPVITYTLLASACLTLSFILFRTLKSN